MFRVDLVYGSWVLHDILFCPAIQYTSVFWPVASPRLLLFHNNGAGRNFPVHVCKIHAQRECWVPSQTYIYLDQVLPGCFPGWLLQSVLSVVEDVSSCIHCFYQHLALYNFLIFLLWQWQRDISGLFSFASPKHHWFWACLHVLVSHLCFSNLICLFRLLPSCLIGFKFFFWLSIININNVPRYLIGF